MRSQSSVLTLLFLAFCLSFPLLSSASEMVSEDQAVFVETQGSKTGDTIGGDDIIVENNTTFQNCQLAIAQNGDIYMVTQGPSSSLQIYRSQDGGDSYLVWGYLDESANLVNPVLAVCDGHENRLYLAYEYADGGFHEIRLRYAPLDQSWAVWSTEKTVFSSSGINFSAPDICSNDDYFASYGLFVVATGQDLWGRDIWYSQSLDYGETWLAKVAIGPLGLSDRYYDNPDVAVGLGGWVHVAWEYGFFADTYDTSLRYRRCLFNDAGDIANWEPIRSLSLLNNGIDEVEPQMAADAFGQNIVVVCRRMEKTQSGSYWIYSPGVVVSYDRGISFESLTVIDGALNFVMDLQQQPYVNALYLAGFHNNRFGFQRSTFTDPTSWQPLEIFTNEDNVPSSVRNCGLAFDASRENQVAMAWIQGLDGISGQNLVFDADWRSGPGYPNLEDGFPIDLAVSFSSSPTLVDLDGGGDLEIVFSNGSSSIEAIDHEGHSLPGWPVTLGETVSDGPIAVGDLVGYGEMCVVAGTNAGQVVAFNSGGNLLPGFPRTIQSGKPTYVSIGNLGGHYKGTIVAGSGTRLEFLNFKGELVAGSYGYTLNTGDIKFPPAIGDLDNDGIREIIFTTDHQVTFKRMREPSRYRQITTASTYTGAPTLGDLDLDGNLEVAMARSNGSISVVKNDGSTLPGFPYYSSSSSDLTSVSWADISGTYEPELAFAANDYLMEALFHDGSSLSGYPVDVSGTWFFHHPPLMGRIGGASASILGATSLGYLYAWSNQGHNVPGWPRRKLEYFPQTMAMGDLDNDNSLEIVVISQGLLSVFDVNSPPSAGSSAWPMEGFNARHTGCFHCPEADLSAVDPLDPQESATGSRFHFAPPVPNPASGPVDFRFEVAGESVARLEVFDVRGHRVRTVLKAEVSAGGHQISWDGRAEGGRALGSGVYFARLRVRGPQGSEDQVRKVFLIR